MDIKKNLNIKNMKETLVNYSGSEEELENIWKTYHHMACMGFIDHNTWMKFFEACKGWYIMDDQVRDSAHSDLLIHDYSFGQEYKA